MTFKPYKPDTPLSNPLDPVSTTKKAECPMCKEVFTTPGLADKHLKRVSWKVDTYRMVCQDPRDVGMELNKFGYWSIPSEDEWWKEDQ